MNSWLICVNPNSVRQLFYFLNELIEYNTKRNQKALNPVQSTLFVNA
ncbi:hypothetical protein APA_1247 [Pseudanabaena sp. lw0831]|nr:hypothetical protein APA_1247 [Pseudanabaena sp. lw0831]